MDPRLEAARQEAEARYLSQPNVTGVSVGYKYRDGQRTDEIAVVVYVKAKKPLTVLAAVDRVPARIGDVATDVQVGVFRKLVVPSSPLAPLATTPRSLTTRLRPCPGGYSCGHTQITAGTLGAWVLRGTDGRSYILSNNHVLADENRGLPGDDILQPGRYDQGRDPTDRIAELAEFVQIRFDGDPAPGPGPGEPPPDKKCGGLARLYWTAGLGLLNLPGRLSGCEYEAVTINRARRRLRARAIEQPYPNLVDAALAVVLAEGDVLREIAQIGPIAGIRDLQLGDQVRKTGRTTGFTQGVVDAVDGTVQVQYDAGIATFQNQLFIRSTVPGQEFSAGGDSGSVIVDAQAFLGGLLFAGGGGLTIANRIGDVVALLGIRL